MDTNKHFSERELEELEAQLRSFGTPYSSPEPDERYWANFRVHVMDRIDAKQVMTKRSIVAVVFDFFSASAFRGLGISAAVLAIAFAAFFMMRSPTLPQVAETTTPSVQNELPVAKLLPNAERREPAKKSIPKKQLAPVIKEKPSSQLATQVTTPTKSEQMIETAGDFANYDEMLSVGNPDDPIDYAMLTEAELESLVDVADSMN